MRRILDTTVALVLSLLLLPLLLTCAGLVKLSSRGPVLFRQERIGRRGRQFEIFKFRTMVQGAERAGAGLYTESDDSRFTKVGLFLRRWSLDELPQLLNVIRGEMSLVGPRPLPRQIVDRYREEYSVILECTPGLTGYAQIHGRSAIPRSERLAMDIHYVRNRSLRMDLMILLKTLPVILTGRGQENAGLEADVER